VQEIPSDNEAAAVIAAEITLDLGVLPPVAKDRP